MRELFLNRDALFWMMFLRRYQQAQSSGVWKTVTGTPPLTLEYALPKAIKSLIQYGKCIQSGTPSSANPVDIVCNNGTLVAVDDELPLGYKRIESIDFDGDFWYATGKSLGGSDDVTLTVDGTSSGGQNLFGSYNGTSSGTKNFSLYIYGGGSTSSCYFRYGEQLSRPKLGSGERTITFGASGTSGFATDVTVTPDTFETNANTYIGMLPNSSSPAYTGVIIGNILVSDRLKYIPCERTSDGVIGYYEAVNGEFIEPSGTGTPVKGGYDTSHCTRIIVDGTPEVLTIAADGATTQTATVQNLFAVGDYKDEQDLITGVVTRRVAVCVYDGTQTIGNTFLSTTGGKDIGAIIVYPLDESVTEQVTAQPLSTSEGTNTISVTAEVSDVSLEVQYRGEFVKTVTGSLLHIVDALAKPAKKFTATLEPIQDLHGQDAPYPSGGGKNKCDGTAYSCVISSNIAYISNRTPISSPFTTTVNYAGAGFIAPVKAGQAYAMSSDASGSAVFYWAIYASLDDITDRTKVLQNGSTSVTFTADYDGYVVFMRENHPIGQTVTWTYAQIELGTMVSSFAPYSNICPITGHTGASVVRTGVNLFDKTNTFDGYINDINGVYNAQSNNKCTDFISVKGGESYRIITDQTVGMWGAWYDINKQFISGITAYISTPIKTAPNNAAYIRLTVVRLGNGNLDTFALNYPSTDTSYHAYTAQTIPITFPDAAGTVYGGTLTHEGGEWKLSVTDAKLDLGALTWRRTQIGTAGHYFFYYGIYEVNGKFEGNITAEIFKGYNRIVSNWDFSDNSAVIGNTSSTPVLYIRCDAYTDAATFQTAMSGVQLVYELATPIDYTLTSQQVLTLLKGENNIWVNNSDNLVLDYLAKTGVTP